MIRVVQRALVCAVLSIGWLGATPPDSCAHWYHAAHLQAPASYKATIWQSTLGASYTYQHARKGFRNGTATVPLFDTWGHVNLLRLGTGLETPGTKTQQYWNLSGTGSFDYAPLTNPTSTLMPLVLPGNLDGRMSLAGRVRREEFCLWAQQNFWHNLWVRATLPVAWLRVDHINARLLGSQTVRNAQDTADVDMPTFLANDFPIILSEAGYKPLTTPYKKSGIPELFLAAGWSKSVDTGDCLVSGVGGSLAGHLLVPFAGTRDRKYVASLPLGHEQDWGVGARIGVCLGLFNMVQLEMHGGVMAFFDRTRSLRVASDPYHLQTGWLVLETARGRADQEAVWDIGGMISTVPRACWGLVARVGYSFVRQESTQLHVRDNRYLKTTIKNALTENLTTDPSIIKTRFISKDFVANHTPNFVAWEQHVIHLEVGYDAAQAELCWPVLPRITFQYDQVVAGRRTVDGYGLGGTASVSCAWDF